MRRKISILLAMIMAVTVWGVPGGAFAAEDDELSVSLSSGAEITYDGDAQEPELVVKDGEGNEITDYTATYSDNVNAGTATVKVEGTGDYAGQDGSGEFTIEPAELSPDNAEVTVTPENSEYTGEPLTPDVTVTFEGEELTKGTDYVVSYSDNILSPKAKISVQGIGNYTGILSEDMDIAKVENVQVTDFGPSTVTLSWDQQENVDGYKIYSDDSDTALKNVKGNTTTTGKVTGLKADTEYTFAVRAYTSEVVNKKTKYKYGDYSDQIIQTTGVSKATISKATAKPDKTVTVTWKSIRCDEFEIQLAKDADFTDIVETQTTTGTKYVFKDLEKGTYYVRVRGTRAAGANDAKAETYEGKWSDAKKVKATDTGWYTDSKGLKYYYKDGEKLKDGDENGGEYTLTKNDNKFKYYYFDENGVWRGFSREGWKQMDGAKSATTKGGTYAMCVSRSLCRYVIYKKIDGNWAPYKYGLCGPGRKGHLTPTFNVKACGTLGKWKQEKRLHFGDPDGYRCWYYTRVKGTIGLHSVKYRVGSKTRIQTPLYKQIGHNVSHGCIRLSLSDANWTYKHIWKGARIIVVQDDTKKERKEVLQ